MVDEKTKREVYRLFKWGSWVVIMLGIFLLAETLVTLKAWQSADVAANTISVNGEGEAYAVPDVATFTFSVSADAKAVSDAQKTVTTKTNAILADLKNLGVADADVQTTNYSVNPKYIYTTNNPIPDGYTVADSISVKVRQTASAGQALVVVGNDGATNISGLSFTTADPNEGQNEAHAKAIADAQTKADALAGQLGVKIVRVVGYTDNGGVTPPGPIMYNAMSAGVMKVDALPSVPVGQNKITANVTVTYEIK